MIGPLDGSFAGREGTPGLNEGRIGGNQPERADVPVVRKEESFSSAVAAHLFHVLGFTLVLHLGQPHFPRVLVGR